MLNQIIIRPTTTPASPESPGATFCAAAGLDAELPERLRLDPSGRPFEPVALTALDDPAELAAQIDLLLRPDAVGGGEALLQHTGETIGEAALTRLYRRLAAGGELTSAAVFLESLAHELGQIDQQLDGRATQVGRELQACQTALRAWQEATSQRPGLLRSMARWVFGGAGQIALPQAIALWNERERLSMARHAISAARAVVGRVADEVAILQERQEGLRRAAAEALRAAEDRSPTAIGDRYAPWTWQGSPPAIAARLARRIPIERQVATLLAQIAGGEQLAADARALAEARATQLVAGLSIADAITAEAGALDDPAIDPLVLVGQRLLGALEQPALWRLERGARPWIEVVQVTADGEPLFRLDGLGTAAYGDGIPRLGFVCLESGIASADLRTMQEGDEAFQQVLAQRNLYVIEELARAAAPTTAIDDDASSPNGRHLDLVWGGGDD